MTVTVGNIAPASGNQVTVSGRLIQQGTIIQTVYTGSSVRTTYSVNNSGNGTVITQMNLTITPTRSDSVIWCRWTIFYDMHHDTGFVVQKDGSLIGYNLYRGNVRWSNILTPSYDNDYGSTPYTSTINWFDPAGSTSARTYQIAVRSAGGGNFTMGFNRCVGSAGQDDHEVGVSWGWAREISG